jgi:hypothetical protein
MWSAARRMLSQIRNLSIPRFARCSMSGSVRRGVVAIVGMCLGTVEWSNWGTHPNRTISL